MFEDVSHRRKTKSMNSGARPPRPEALPLSFVTLGKFPNLFVLSFLLYEMGMIIVVPAAWVCCED